ncbi:MAG: hypothetical protein ACK4U0_05910 [Mesorhizobium sp.]
MLRASIEELGGRSGEEGRDWAVRRALRAIDEAGIQRWSARGVRLDGLAGIAQAVGLDAGEAEHRKLLGRLLSAATPEQEDALLNEILLTRGETASETATDEIRQSFRAALGTTLDDLETRFVLARPETRDRLTLEWHPSRKEFQLRHEDPGDDWNDPVMTLLRGQVVAQPQESGDGLSLAVRPVENPVTAYSPADLRHLSTALFGRWREADGSVWSVRTLEDERPDDAATTDPTGPSPADRIKDKQRQIDAILASKAYVWRNPETNEETRQERFRRLKEPWIYLGEQYGVAEAEQQIAQLEADIRKLEEQAVPLVEQHDPIGFTQAPAQPVTVTVEQADGYSYSYDEARYDGRRVLARRTLRDRRDITNLPGSVVSQLIASWSPPEWIELEASIDPASGATSVQGQRWRMHVTYSSFFGEAGDVERVHTPWNSAVVLSQDDRRAP